MIPRARTMATTWLTLESRKAEAVASISRGISALREDLAVFAKRMGGKFLMYGSAARGDYRFDSDVDIIVDFPSAKESDAWRFAEEACRRHGLVPDVRPRRYCEKKFIDRIASDAEEIS